MDIREAVTVAGPLRSGFERILTVEALALVADLHREFEPVRRDLLSRRTERVAELAGGGRLDFLATTAGVRADESWRVAAPAPGLEDRRVEITGPTDRKMTINALNSGAKVWLADLEDANAPLWENVVQGQINLRDAALGDISFTNAEGRRYEVTAEEQPTVVVRPRGWHLPEKHLLVDGEPVAGALVDFGLYMANTAQLQIDRGRGPYFYLPKMESHLEARLWNDVFNFAQDRLGMPRGTIRATVLIETFPAAFEMDEILYELRSHSAGLNAGRWDYMFSVIKSFRNRPEFLLPDRNAVTMEVPFMRAYTELLVRTCHRRGAHAIGGMSAFVPSKDPAANEHAFAKLSEDKEREARAGFDGSWVAHPGMVAACREVFDGVLGDRPHQLDRQRPEVDVTADQLLDVAATPGQITETGLRVNVGVGIRYVESWLRGQGAVAIDGLMEDAATAEISRSQVWQWLHNGAELDDGTAVDRSVVDRVVEEEMARIAASIPPDDFAAGRWRDAREVFTASAVADDYPDFLTLAAYERTP